MIDITQLRHGFRTDLKKGTICNADVALIILHSLGGVARTGQLLGGMQTWRPGPQYDYLFNKTKMSSGYGFVGDGFHSSHNEVYHHGSGQRDGHTTLRRTYWYRSARGVYTITAEGHRRLAELGVK